MRACLCCRYQDEGRNNNNNNNNNNNRFQGSGTANATGGGGDEHISFDTVQYDVHGRIIDQEGSLFMTVRRW